MNRSAHPATEPAVGEISGCDMRGRLPATYPATTRFYPATTRFYPGVRNYREPRKISSVGNYSATQLGAFGGALRNVRTSELKRSSDCLRWVERQERMMAKASTPISERKKPETFCLSLGIRRSRSAWLLSKGTCRSVRKRRTSLRCSRSRRMRLQAGDCLTRRGCRDGGDGEDCRLRLRLQLR